MKIALALLLVGGCGRIGFDPGDGAGGGGGDGDARGSGSGANDGDVSGDSASVEPLGAFGAPTQIAVLGIAGRADQNPSLTEDLLEIYFDSNRSCASCYDLFVSTRSSVAMAWPAPTALAALNSAKADLTPEVSRDGLTLWFSSDRTGSVGADIWVSTRPDRASAWGAPVREAALSTSGYDADPGISDDGLAMTTSSDGSGGAAADMFVATRASVSDAFSAPAPIAELNTTLIENSGVLRANRRELYFASETAAIQYELYLATRPGPTGPFGAPVPLDTLNDPTASDVGVWISPDRHTVYFSSARTGDMEIYSATR